MLSRVVSLTQSREFRTLIFLSGESSVINLGRLMTLAVESYKRNTALITPAEINQLVEWNHRVDVLFSELLLKAGLAVPASKTSKGRLRLTYPGDNVVLCGKALSGSARACTATRNEKGQFLPGRKSKETKVEKLVDPDGNVVSTDQRGSHKSQRSLFND